MENNFKNLFEIIFGIAFAVLFKWKIYSIYNISERTPVQITVFFAGLFVFYLSMHVCKYFYRCYKNYGIFSYGTLTGVAFVTFLIVIMLSVHTPRETINVLKGILIIWGLAIIALTIIQRR
ncbi:hypothetical protein [Paenibacillus solanacearum]|uniref:hypothetical protein n=1 Tax=Paenibacillus solanacearum TaxID=2048548 RepID=UPI001C404209|nr:hypothetical protein [Paenibacillus solanacearum]